RASADTAPRPTPHRARAATASSCACTPRRERTRKRRTARRGSWVLSGSRYPRWMLELNVAPGIHRVEDAHTNWYLVEDERQLTIVDAGVPASWDSLMEGLGALERATADL